MRLSTENQQANHTSRAEHRGLEFKVVESRLRAEAVPAKILQKSQGEDIGGNRYREEHQGAYFPPSHQSANLKATTQAEPPDPTRRATHEPHHLVVHRVQQGIPPFEQQLND